MCETRNSSLLRKITVLFVICFFALSAKGKYSGGTGEPNYPYQINNVADWQELMSGYADWDKWFILTADLNLEGVTLTPVGSGSNEFKGIFDGREHTITNAIIDLPGSYYTGLFGKIGNNANILNLNVVNCYVVGETFIGGLVGSNTYGTVINCSSTGTIIGKGAVGGLIGQNRYGTVINIYSECNVDSDSGSAGGLIGWNDKGAVYTCYSTGVVSGNLRVGGLIGDSGGTVINSYSSGTVVGVDYVGGLTGVSSGIITDCYSTGTVDGNEYVGGLIGSTSRTVTNSYSSGLVTATGDFVGGFTGRVTSANIAGCFWDTETSTLNTSAGGVGVVGLTTEQMKNPDYFTAAGWDTIGQTADGYRDLWVLEFGQYPQLSYYHSQYDFLGQGNAEDPYQIYDLVDLCAVNRNIQAYYKLMNNIDFTGIQWASSVIPKFYSVFDGNYKTLKNFTVNQPDKDEVAIFGHIGTGGEVSNLHITDVNIFAHDYIGCLAGWILNCKINNCSVTGILKGTGYTVGGLIGRTFSSTISNCQSSVSVHASGHSVGGLVGDNYKSSVINCHSWSTVSGDWNNLGGLIGHNYLGTVINSSCTSTVFNTDPYVDYVGGLIGYSSSSLIDSCYSNSQTTGRYYVGGLLGYNSVNTVENSYSTGQINGTSDIGGMIGKSTAGTVVNSYSTCIVGNGERTGAFCGNVNNTVFTACFWNSDISSDVNGIGNGSNPNVIGLTTAQMQMLVTFMDAGWDFNTPVWTIDDGVDYPRLWWEYVPVLHAEPDVTLGTSNRISWEPVVGGVEYYAECAEDVNFTSIIYSTGWITETSYEFTGLQLGQRYWYRVKARNSAGTESQWSNVESSLQCTLAEAMEIVLESINLKSENLKEPYINKINTAQEMIDSGNFTSALNKLENDILQKTDGCGETGEPDKSDWIITCEEQAVVYPLIIETIEHVRSLIE